MSYATVTSSMTAPRVDVDCRLTPALPPGEGVVRASSFAFAHAGAAVRLPPMEFERCDWSPTGFELTLRLPIAKQRKYTGLGVTDVVDGLRTLRNAMLGFSDAGEPDLREVRDGLSLQRALSLTRGPSKTSGTESGPATLTVRPPVSTTCVPEALKATCSALGSTDVPSPCWIAMFGNAVTRPSQVEWISALASGQSPSSHTME